MNTHGIDPIDWIEADFLAAIERLDRRTPNNPQNKEAMERGRLKITFSSLAKEAGHSRTHICYEESCGYPRIRKIVLDRRHLLKQTSQAIRVTTTPDLSDQTHEIERELVACRQKMHETILRAERDRKEFNRLHEIDQREIAELKEMVLSLQESGGKVLHLTQVK